MKTRADTNAKAAMHTQEHYEQLLDEDTFKELQAPSQMLMARILSEDPRWLPRMPQAPAHIQLFILTDNHTHLFSDVKWKFDLEVCLPGITAFRNHYHHEGYAMRQSTPALAADGSELTWTPDGSFVSGQGWSDWLLLLQLVSFIRVTGFPKEHVAVLATLDWPFAKAWIEAVLEAEGPTDIETYAVTDLLEHE